MSADIPTLFDHLPPTEDSPVAESPKAWEDMSPEERARRGREGVRAAQEMMAEWYALRAELAGRADPGTDDADSRQPRLPGPDVTATAAARKCYAQACGGCGGFFVYPRRPPGDVVDPLDREQHYCPKCTEKNEARMREWGKFQKGDRVKLRYRGFIWSKFEELSVLSVSEDKQFVTVQHLGFPGSTAEVRTVRLTFASARVRM